MSSQPKITGTVEAWESRTLGADAEFARRAPADLDAKIDASLNLHAISIRLPKDVIETYKLLAKMHGIGYQPLMRDAICRFAEAELKQVLINQLDQQDRAASAHGMPLAA